MEGGIELAIRAWAEDVEGLDMPEKTLQMYLGIIKDAGMFSLKDLSEVSSSKKASDHFHQHSYLGQFLDWIRGLEIQDFENPISDVSNCREENVVDGDVINLLMWVCLNGRLSAYQYLTHHVKLRFDMNRRDSKYGRTPLIAAAIGGNVDIIMDLIDQHGVDATVLDNKGLNPLMWACMKGHVSACQYLINHEKLHWDLNQRNNIGRPLLIQAAAAGHVDIIRILLDQRGADAVILDDEGMNLLMWVCNQGHFSAYQYLMNHDKLHFDLNLSDNDEMTPLMHAIVGGNVDIIRDLVDHRGADATVVRSNDMNLLMLACDEGNISAYHFLVGHDCLRFDVNQRDGDGQTALIYAAIGGSIEIIRDLVDQRGADATVVDSDGMNLLMLSCSKGHASVYQYLISHEKLHFDLNLRDKRRRTPLICAAIGGNVDIIQDLIEQRGADATVVGPKNVNLLMFACSHGCASAYQYLIRHQKIHFDLSQRDDDMNTALLHATFGGNVEIIRDLIDQRGADVRILSGNGMNLLMSVCNKGDAPSYRYLICHEKLQCDLNQCDQSGQTALIHAAIGGSVDIIQDLIDQRRADATVVGNNGMDLLMCVCNKGHTSAYKYLINHEKLQWDLNRRDLFGHSALLLAGLGVNLDIIRDLIDQRGADATAVSKHGINLLMLACRHQSVAAYQYLIKHDNLRWDLNQRDITGRNVHAHASNDAIIRDLNMRCRRDIQLEVKYPRLK